MLLFVVLPLFSFLLVLFDVFRRRLLLKNSFSDVDHRRRVLVVVVGGDRPRPMTMRFGCRSDENVAKSPRVRFAIAP